MSAGQLFMTTRDGRNFLQHLCRNLLYLREPTPPNIYNTLSFNHLQPNPIVGTPLQRGYLPQTQSPKPLTISTLQNQSRRKSKQKTARNPSSRAVNPYNCINSRPISRIVSRINVILASEGFFIPLTY